MSRPIACPAGAVERLVAVPLDSPIYAATRDGLPDLRIFDQNDAEVPYVLEKVRENVTHTERRTSPSKVVSLQETDDGGLVVVLELEDKAPSPTGIEFHTHLIDYQRRVSVAGSDAGGRWTPLVEDALIADYTRYMDVRNREVRLPANSFRRFRVTVAQVTDEHVSPLTDLTRRLRDNTEQERIERTQITRRPFRMDRIELWYEVSRTEGHRDVQIDYPARFDTEEDPKEKTTIVQVQTQGEPLTGLTLETESRNFSRTVQVQTSVPQGMRTEWRTVGQGRVSHLDFGVVKQEELSVNFREQREKTYRLVIQNGDSPAVKITGVRGQGPAYRAVFLADPAEKYRMVFGSQKVEAPRYDTAAITAALRASDEPVVAALDEVVESEVTEPASVRDLVNNRVFLIAMVCLMVAVLGWGLYRAARRVENLPRE